MARLGPKRPSFDLQQAPVESLCESVFGEAPDSVLLKQIYGSSGKPDTQTTRDDTSSTEPFDPSFFATCSSIRSSAGTGTGTGTVWAQFAFGLLGFQDNPARVVSNDVPGDGNCFFYALFRALAHKDFPYLDQLPGYALESTPLRKSFRGKHAPIDRERIRWFHVAPDQ